MPENKTKASDLLDNAPQSSGRRLGQPEKTPATATLDEMSEEQLRQLMRERGFELHKEREPRQSMAKPDRVSNKLRISLHLPKELRVAMKAASLETKKSESTIGTEAITMWMESNNFGNWRTRHT